MAKNTGKPSERLFEERINSYGKNAWYHRLIDASTVYGLTKKRAAVASQPSDYLLVINGVTEFAEVKSSVHVKLFGFNLLRASQAAAATMILAAGGRYMVYAHCIPTNRWYCFPYQLILDTRALNRASLTWAELEQYEW